MVHVSAKAALVAASIAGATACGGDMMTGPAFMRHAMLMAVTPQPGAVGVPTSTSITVRFGAAMAGGMEQFVDLHQGDLAGPVVAMSCGWSPDRTTLTCMPQTPLEARTLYTVHLGGGMTDAFGHPVDMSQWGMPMGGQWAHPGMMGPNHAGMPWGGMSPVWMASNGSYGMGFTFTTG